jgi:hypothetical protein
MLQKPAQVPELLNTIEQLFGAGKRLVSSQLNAPLLRRRKAEFRQSCGKIHALVTAVLSLRAYGRIPRCRGKKYAVPIF